MNIIQFKRGTADNDSKRTTLNAGEIYVNTANNSVWVGKESGQFQIGSYGEVVTNISSDASSDPTKAKFIVTFKTASGSTRTQGIEANISGTVASAQRLTSNAGKDGTSGIMNPIYFSGGVPRAMQSTIGSITQPVYIKDGKVTECEQMLTGIKVATTSNKYYLYGGPISASGSAGTTLNTLSDRTDTYVDTEGNVNVSGIKINNLSSSGGIVAQPLLCSMSNKVYKSIGVGSGSKPIYIDSTGTPKECDSLPWSVVKTNASITGSGNATSASSLGMTSNGLYIIYGYHGTWVVPYFSGKVSVSSLCPYLSESEDKASYLEINTSGGVYAYLKRYNTSDGPTRQAFSGLVVYRIK